MIKLIIIGPRGKMGRLIAKYAQENYRIDIVGGVAPKGRDYIGQDVGTVSGLELLVGAPVVDNLEKIIEKCDEIGRAHV